MPSRTSQNESNPPPLPPLLFCLPIESRPRPKALKAPGYRVVTTYTPDHAVAICLNNPVDVVILDQEHFIQTEGWSVAKSIRMIRQKIRVILVVRGKIIGNYLPDGVDAIVQDHDEQALMATVKHLLKSY